MDTLIIGASGPVGRATIGQFLNRKEMVVGVSRATATPVDFLNTADVEQIIDRIKPRNIVLLATPSAAEPDASSKNDRYLDAVKFLVRTAADAGAVRVVFSSSAAVYGTTSTIVNLNEQSSANGTSAYALLKLKSEVSLAEECEKRGLEHVNLRIFNVYGPGAENSLINRLLSNQTDVWDTDDFGRDYVHVEDVARAIYQATTSQATLPPVINVASGDLVTNLQLIQSLPGLDGNRRKPYLDAPSFSLGDPLLAASSLGFETQVNVLEFMTDKK